MGYPTISYPNPSADKTNAFYESNVNYWKATALKAKLEAVGVEVQLSRTEEQNPSISERAAMALQSGADYFISIQSNKDASDGTLTNYLSLGVSSSADVSIADRAAQQAYALAAWPYLFEVMGEGLEVPSAYTYDNPRINSDPYPILSHAIPGFVSESFFHTYQPARHRALSRDYCRMEAVRLYRAVAAQFADKLPELTETTGYIMGVVKSATEKMTQSTTLSPTSYAYREGSHDQWVPLNGSVVYLLNEDGSYVKGADGNRVSYTVDNNYNGVFVFENIKPGKYKIKATCNGYLDLFEDVEVVANRTAYPVMLLSKGVTPMSSLTMNWNWNMNFNEIKGTIKRVLQWDDNIVVLSHESNADRTPHIYVINQRVISEKWQTANAENMNALTEDAFKNPAWKEGVDEYKVPKYLHIRELSLRIGGAAERTITRDATNAGEYLSISDIAITDDGQLIACNFIRCQSSDANVDAGFKRGAVKIYKWQTLNANPLVWVTATHGLVGSKEGESTLSGNFERGEVGFTMAVDGKADNCHITLSAVNGKAPNDESTESQTELRYVHLNVVNNVLQTNLCSWTKSSLPREKQEEFLKIGEGNMNGYRLSNSPLGSQRWVIDAGNITAYEFIETQNGHVNTPNGDIAEDVYGVAAMEVNYVHYNGHCLAVAPWYDGIVPQGVRVLDVSNGFDQEAEVETGTALDLAQPIAHTEFSKSVYAVATAQNDKDAEALHIFHFSEGDGKKKLVKYSTITAQNYVQTYKSAEKGIYAYSLKNVPGSDYVYTLMYKVNDTPKKAYLVIYMPDGKTELDRIDLLSSATKESDGYYTLPVDAWKLYTTHKDKGLNYGDKLNWAIEVENNRVTEWTKLYENTNFSGKVKRFFNTVDNSPQSDMFGYIYLSLQQYNTNQCGIYVINPNYTPKNSGASSTAIGTPFLGYKTYSQMGYPGRIAVDKNGTLYIPTYYYDNTSGGANSAVWRTKFTVNASDQVQAGTLTRFLGKSANWYGTLMTGTSGNGSYLGYRPPCVSIQNLKDGGTRMWLMNIHNAIVNASPLSLYDLCVTTYDIAKVGQAIPNTWNTTPNRNYDIGINEVSKYPWYHGGVQATDHGYWVSIPRQVGMNGKGAEALQFYAHETDANKGGALYNTINNADMMGTNNSGVIVSSDESLLVFAVCESDAVPEKGEFLVYDISWNGNTPTLTLRDRYTHGHGTFWSLSLDYAGNLIATGTEGVFIYGMPTKGENKKLTPSPEPITLPTVDTQTEPLGDIAIYAYDLRVDTVKKDLSEYCFSFKVNENATEAKLVFHTPGTDNPTLANAVCTLALTQKPTIEGKTVVGHDGLVPRDVVAQISEMQGNDMESKRNQNFSFAGYNSYFIAAEELAAVMPAGTVMQDLSWGVWVKSKAVTGDMNIIKQSNVSYAAAHHAIDNSPESDYFGRIYVANQTGTNTSDNGIWVYNYPDFSESVTWTSVNTAVYKGGRTWGKPARPAVAADGTVFFADHGDTYSGVWVADPDHIDGTYSSFFQGKHQSSGMYLNGTVGIGSSASFCFVHGTGEKTELYVGNQDSGNGLTANTVVMYKIGQENGSILTSWNEAPTQSYTEKQMGNGNMDLCATSKGVFISQTRGWEDATSTNNTVDYPSLIFYKYGENTVLYNSGSENGNNLGLTTAAVEKKMTSNGSGFAVTYDESQLLLHGANYKMQLYNISWHPSTNKPTLTLNKTYTSFPLKVVKRMSFDYAGNLFVSGGGKIYVYSFPKADNSCFTPAKQAMTVKYVHPTPKTDSPARGVFAYDLRVEGTTNEGNPAIMPNEETNDYTFSFKLNAEVKNQKAVLKIYDTNDQQVATFDIPNVHMGINYFTLAADELPGEHLDVFTWAIEVEGTKVTEWGVLYDENNAARTNGFNAINLNTESDAFAKIYTYYAGDNEQRIYTPVLRGENDSWTNTEASILTAVSAMAADASGNIYFANKNASKLYKGVPDVDKLTVTELATGNAIMGMGAYGNTLWQYANTNKLLQYNLTTNSASEFKTISASPEGCGNVVGTAQGVFVSQHGEWGWKNGHYVNNNQAPTLQFYDNSGNALFSSNTGDFSYMINGSSGGAFAVTPDGSKLILQNATQQFLVFDVKWTGSTPSLTLVAVYNHGKEDIHQMTFDYANNLIATGKGGMTVFAIPTGDDNIHETPASVERRQITKYKTYYNRIFKNYTGDKQWSNPNNWKPHYVPEAEHSVLIQADCEVDMLNATARFIDIQKGSAIDDDYPANPAKDYGSDAYPTQITIMPNAGLYVQETIRKVTGDNYDGSKPRELHTTADLIVKNNIDGQGALVQFDTEGKTPATVELYGRHESSSAHWQYVSLPFVEGIALTNFEGSWLARWDEPNMTWAYLGAYETVPTFRGHLLLQPTPKTYTLKGNIAASKSHTFTLSRKDASVGDKGEYGYNRGSNFLGNSWTAPLYIGNMSIKDFDNAHAEATIYIYNYAEIRKDADTQKELPGNYVTVPVGLARLDNVTTHVINPLQGFFVMVKSDLGETIVGNVGEVAFDYATLVNYPSKGEPTIPELNPYRIVRRNPNDAAQEAAEWWIVEPDNGYQTPLYDMSMRVADAEGHRCELQLYESAKFTYGFDNGYDGRKLNDEAAHPYLAAVSEKGDMAVLATPSFDGTFLNFKKGTGASASYTITFTYDGEDDYLLEDAIAGTATEIRTGKSYTFVPSADDKYRFRIVRSQRAPDITTDAPNVWASDDKLYLTNPAGLRTEVSVYSADGQLMERMVTYDSLMPLNVPATGVYVIEVRSEWGVRTIKHIM